MKPEASPRVEALGDCALIARFEGTPGATLVARVQALAQRLTASAPAGVVDVVPAYASVAVHVSPGAAAGDPGLLPRVEAWMRAGTEAADAASREARLVEIVVTYDGPDLADVARHTGLDVDDVIARHAAPEYLVAMLGFAPGFPYLVGLDPALATPRHATPRTRVAAGSVGIGGAQTGVYPRESPGGWQIIGHADAVLFDPAREPPSLLQPGDRVRFVPRR